MSDPSPSSSRHTGIEQDRNPLKPRNVFKDLEVGKNGTQVFASATGELFTVESAKVLDGAIMVNGQIDNPTLQQFSNDHRARNVGQTSTGLAQDVTEDAGNLTEEYTQRFGVGRSL